MKCKQMLPWVIIFQICDLIITCLLVCLLSASFIGENGVTFKAWRRAEDNKVQLEEFKAWSHNTSSIFKPNVFHHNVNTKCLGLQDEWLKNNEHTMHLLNATNLIHFVFLGPPPIIGPTTHANSDKPTRHAPFHVLNQTDMDVLYEHALRMTEFEDTITAFQIYRLYPEILVQFAKVLVDRQPKLLKNLDNIYNNQDIEKFYKTFTIEDGGKTLTPSSVISLENLIANIHCINLNDTTEAEFINQTRLDLKFWEVQKYITDSCYYKVFLNVLKDESCKSDNLTNLMDEMFADYKAFEQTLALFILSVTILYLILDVIERCVFLTKAVIYQTSPWDMLITAFGYKAPGSYLRKQLNIISCCYVIAAYIIFQYTISTMPHIVLTGNQFYAYMNWAAILFIFSIVITLCHAYSFHAIISWNRTLCDHDIHDGNESSTLLYCLWHCSLDFLYSLSYLN